MKSGYINNKHYTEYIETVKKLNNDNKYEEAILLLNSLIDANEKESRSDNLGVAPWYYEELAIIYSKQKDISNEISILERFSHQKHAPGVKPQKLLERLNKLKFIIS
jgi:hypothetical protein